MPAVLDNKCEINILVVDASPGYRKILMNGISANFALKVVSTAVDAYDAREKLVRYQPDVMVLDMSVSRMDVLPFIKLIMSQCPLPIVVIGLQTARMFEALAAGAMEFATKPMEITNDTMRHLVGDLCRKIVMVYNAYQKKRREAKNMQSSFHNTLPKIPVIQPVILQTNRRFTGVIAIGASTGGTEATSAILRALPPNLPGIIVTQHMPPVFTDMYAKRLDRETSFSVKEAEDGDVLKQGTVLIAPGGTRQVRVIKRGADHVVRCTEEGKVSGHCPSVDVLFESVSKFADKECVGVILTGMGADGANGLFSMRRAGAFTIGQDESSCVVYGMPMMAYKMGAVVKQANLADIPMVLVNYMKNL